MEPAGLLTYGVRDFLSTQFKGRPRGGNIFRTVLDDYGQCIMLRVTGLPEDHERLISEVLQMQNAEGQMFWEYTVNYKPVEWISIMPTMSFTITQPARGSIRAGFEK